MLIQFPDIAPAWGSLTEAVTARPGLSERAREAVILRVCGHFDARYATHAHTLAAKRRGLGAAQIDALCAGVNPVNLTDEQACAVELVDSLLQGGVLPAHTYDHAVTVIGQDALDAVVLLTLYYTAACVLLNAYDVPADS
ncbi:carboxymuconolactone decarboxylase family protein [uncultured Jatrophihabitans sp.]|uniref:carboxymuconolactone decarboxylase family protein n=1 Tax=uncultured Jatrophihabitans sp. TaxID=1610747 RepID=UPI0035C9B378